MSKMRLALYCLLCCLFSQCVIGIDAWQLDVLNSTSQDIRLIGIPDTLMIGPQGLPEWTDTIINNQKVLRVLLKPQEAIRINALIREDKNDTTTFLFRSLQIQTNTDTIQFNSRTTILKSAETNSDHLSTIYIKN